MIRPDSTRRVKTCTAKPPPRNAQYRHAGPERSGTVQQGFVETSNVNVVEELVGMIQTQRAYELSSKSIQTADQMLQSSPSCERNLPMKTTPAVASGRNRRRAVRGADRLRESGPQPPAEGRRRAPTSMKPPWWCPPR